MIYEEGSSKGLPSFVIMIFTLLNCHQKRKIYVFQNLINYNILDFLPVIELKLKILAMKKSISSVIFLLFVLNCIVSAQENEEKAIMKNEIAVSTSFDNLSLRYSRYISNDLFIKMGIIDLQKDYKEYTSAVGFALESSFRTTSSKNGGLLIGLEKQRSINKLAFSYGLNMHLIYNYTNNITEDINVPVGKRDMNYYTYTPGLGLGLGFYYKIIPALLLGFEINPSINYDFMRAESADGGFTNKDGNFYVSLSNNAAIFALKFKF